MIASNAKKGRAENGGRNMHIVGLIFLSMIFLSNHFFSAHSKCFKSATLDSPGQARHAESVPSWVKRNPQIQRFCGGVAAHF
jgi:hypothetical protein